MNNSQYFYKEHQQNNYNKELKSKLLDSINNIPDSNGISYYDKIDLNVAIMADEFMLNYYKDAVNLIHIDYENYNNLFENNKIDVLIFVTCWKYISHNVFTTEDFSYAIQRQRIYKIIDTCISKNIPVIFQSTEDPVNYDYFIDIARKCDYIFTSDKDIIDKYKIDCSNENVFLLEYGINPKIHNPIGMKANDKLNSVFFAGSWYSFYDERCKDMVKIFDGVIESGKKLDIIDRFFDLNNEEHYFPQKYIAYTIPSIDYINLQKVHKLYNWTINLNSVKYSNTMCARRIYEAQALGNIILSNYSIAVNNYNPNVFIINNKEEVNKILNSYSSEDIYRHQVYGIRNVMSNQTVFERVKSILDIIGITYDKILEKKVLVVTTRITDRIMNAFNRQTYKNKFLIEEKDMKYFYNQYDFISFFKEDYTYGEYYLQDMLNGFKYTNSNYVTKESYYLDNYIVYGKEHSYVNVMKDKYKTIFKVSSYEIKDLDSYDEKIDLPNGYSIDHFELHVKKARTKKINNVQVSKLAYDISIIIPIYNNGKYLLNKGFMSLLRSSIFQKMEIILVDDGSCDLETLLIIDRIEKRYSNVKVYKFEQGGSGSASRPRNKGIELSTCDYITFLDPDDEAINDGYYKLYNEIKNSDYDFVFGYSIMMTNKEYIFKYSNERIINNPKENLLKNNFFVNRIHTCLIKKKLILDSNLNMVEGAIGEDSLFFTELMLNANKAKAIDEAIQIYYGSIEGSVTNKIDINFFNKSYKVEVEMVKKLKKYNVLDDYIKLRLEPYFECWFMEKIKYISMDDVEEITEILVNILKLYGDLDIKSVRIRRFLLYAKDNNYSKLTQEFFNNIDQVND